jgi:uncharacterized protein YfaP (DUF2135 family)
MRRRRTWVAVLVALPILIVTIASLAYFSAELTSPCVGWGGGNFYRSAGAREHCVQYTVRSQTRAQAALTKAAVQGIILVAAALGIWGTARARQAVAIVAGLLMLLEMIPTLFSVSPLALLAGSGFLVVAYRMPDGRAAKTAP